MEIRQCTALELGSLIREKKISSPEVTRVFLDAAKADFAKADTDETKINAYASLNEEAAMAQAE